MDDRNNDNDLPLSSNAVDDLKKSVHNVKDETIEIIEEFKTQIISNINNIDVKQESMKLIDDLLIEFEKSSDITSKNLNQLSDLLISKEEE
jgi:flagellar basal body rod protein FlgB